jgi:hypothetical protein
LLTDIYTPFYECHDETHQIDHVLEVTATALLINDKLNLNLNKDILVISGMLHDLFNNDRKNHHIKAKNYIIYNKIEWLSKYSEPFDSFDEETKESIIEEMIEIALKLVNEMEKESSLKLGVREGRRTHRYYEFVLRPEHFELTTDSEFEQRIIRNTGSTLFTTNVLNQLS